MFRQFLRSKIHRAIVTESDLNYEGSITISQNLLSAAKMIEFEKVEIYNINNGERFSTYIIADKDNTGKICVNGAGARLVQKGDKIIICSYYFSDHINYYYGNSKLPDYSEFKPIIVHVDDQNNIIK